MELMLDIQLGRRNLSPIQRIAIAEKLGNPNPMKLGRCIKELDRLYGIKNGGSGFYGNQHGKNEELTNNFTAPQKTEKDIADMMGISRQQLQNYKKLTEMIPELEELVDTGNIKTYK